MTRINLLISLSALTTSWIGAPSMAAVSAGSPKVYKIYFTRHADSDWNQHKDGKALSREKGYAPPRPDGIEGAARPALTPEDTARLNFERKFCSEMDKPSDSLGSLDATKIQRSIEKPKGGTFKAIAAKWWNSDYIDAKLSERGKMQANCLQEWVFTKCSEKNPDACRLQGQGQRGENLIFLVSNLRRTRQTAFEGYKCENDDMPKIEMHALSILQERGCNADAVPAETPAGATPEGLVEGRCKVIWNPVETQDLCSRPRETQMGVYEAFVDYVKGYSGESDPIFIVTGHSSWLMEFFRSKLPDEKNGVAPNALEIKLTRGKLGNASVIKFELAVDGDKSWIVPSSTKLVFGYYKGGKEA